MNKRICFAGFDDSEIASLKQAIAGNVRAWDCTFANDGPGALAEISAESFDAVVASMDMPGMSGAEILQQAGKLQPGALRFIVGDTSDTSIIFSCVNGGNNFIARTFPPEEILSAVQRGFDLDAQVMSEEFARETQSRAAESAAAEKPDRDWLLRILIPATAIALIAAGLLWWNRRSGAERVLRVKALATESPAPARQDQQEKVAPATLPADSSSGFAQTKTNAK